MKRIWRRFCALLVLCLSVFAVAEVRAEVTDTPIGRIAIEISPLTCGQKVEPDEAPSCNIKPTVSVEQGDSAWITAWDADGYTPLQAVIEGGQAYTAYLALIAKPGYCFSADTRVMLYNPEIMGHEAVAP